MVKVTRTIHQALSAGITLVSRQFLVYQIHVLIQSIFRGIRAHTLRTRKSPVIMLRLDVTPQVASCIELAPTLSTRVFTTLVPVGTSAEVWIANARRNVSRGRRKVLALITIVSLLSFDAANWTIGGHLANTQMMPISSLEAEKLFTNAVIDFSFFSLYTHVRDGAKPRALNNISCKEYTRHCGMNISLDATSSPRSCCKAEWIGI